ncbi:MAG: 1-deoxy-D-xylulose 5-phosphate reductoisomerase [Candidatus Peregrinibacteria bacterium GW2011_GWA2_43_8]|nr:MAG: 1-deoxy-D-xylulose 5-phosphate reductoisomerase [Candidatus Peregrinibacteria bacterium GW2011_GWA2_43_8]
MKRIIILGSTGSIGRQVLEVVAKNKTEFKVIGISGYKNTKLLKEQASKFHVQKIADTDTAIIKIAAQKCDLVVNAISGLAGLAPTLAAIRAGKNLAVANKESLVAQGAKIMSLAKKHAVRIIPIDSEHSAISQCLVGRDVKSVKRIILTCSGGPFLGRTKKELAHATVASALNHPTWEMGKKITIDSATLMNKGFEIIEAHHLFGIPYEKIAVLIHPQSIVHGMVEFLDGSLVLQASAPDMRIPIAYALGARWTTQFKQLGTLTFGEVDHLTFEGIKIAVKYRTQGEKLVRVNDSAVEKFLRGEIKFLEIYSYIRKQMRE